MSQEFNKQEFIKMVALHKENQVLHMYKSVLRNAENIQLEIGSYLYDGTRNLDLEAWYDCMDTIMIACRTKIQELTPPEPECQKCKGLSEDVIMDDPNWEQSLVLDDWNEVVEFELTDNVGQE